MLGRFAKRSYWEIYLAGVLCSGSPVPGRRDEVREDRALVCHEVGRLIPEAPVRLLPSGADPHYRKDRLRRLAHSARVPSR